MIEAAESDALSAFSVLTPSTVQGVQQFGLAAVEVSGIEKAGNVIDLDRRLFLFQRRLDGGWTVAQKSGRRSASNALQGCN